MRRRVAPGLVLAMVGALAMPAAAPARAEQEQLAFGVKMAQRGLWSEALFRFRQADQAQPGNPRVLNNLAVAYEAVGLFDEALESYKAALKLDPANRELRRNYARFIEFYQAFKPEDEEPEEQEPAGEEPVEPGVGEQTTAEQTPAGEEAGARPARTGEPAESSSEDGADT